MGRAVEKVRNRVVGSAAVVAMAAAVVLMAVAKGATVVISKLQ